MLGLLLLALLSASPSASLPLTSAAPEPAPSVAASGVLHESKSQFGTITVDEHAGIRRLVFDGVAQTAVKVGEPKYLVHEYTRLMMAGWAVSEARRVLVIGLGGGAMPSFLHAHAPALFIDAVEIEPVVKDLARKYFGLPESERVRVFVDDGARFVEQRSERYDLILLDAYAPDFIPKHLATEAFFRQVRARLSDTGVLVTNVWGPPNPDYTPIQQRQREVFGNLVVLVGQTSGNHVFIAKRSGPAPSQEELVERALQLQRKYGLHYDLAGLVKKGFATRF